MAENGRMKTTIDIPDQELRDVLEFTRATTKREAVVTAIMAFNRRERLARLAERLGTFTGLVDRETILRQRLDRPVRRK
jgi:Arc/MetJ family transcription regulator